MSEQQIYLILLLFQMHTYRVVILPQYLLPVSTITLINISFWFLVPGILMLCKLGDLQGNAQNRSAVISRLALSNKAN